MIDLRSDTVTRPSAPMLAAMTAAEVGDDVWGDDPTVARLQAVVAERAGKEAAVESEPSIALGVAVRNAPTRRRCPASASGLST
ncbi:low-specificity L-threonine aldolase [Burkholderia pseudomallei]|nr:low-specificity L-threonine aldolase [Burkholderia pseudomallei]